MTFSIPESWSIATIGDISDKIHYGYTEKSSIDPIGPKFLRITDIQNNCVDWKKVPYCSISDNDKNKYILKPGDIVFARTGATVGKSFLIGTNIPESIFASYLIRIIPSYHISAKYIYLSQLITGPK
jgi:type I restriction enzyme S subunit